MARIDGVVATDADEPAFLGVAMAPLPAGDDAAANRQLRAANFELGERIKELNCLYRLADLARQGLPLAETLALAVHHIPEAWCHPEWARARILMDGREYSSANFRATPWRQAATILRHGQPAGLVEVCYTESWAAPGAELFLKEERWLLDALAERIGRMAELQATEQELREYQQRLQALASEMTLSEERQRRELATDLHDGVGQILALLKMKCEALRQAAGAAPLAGELDALDGLVARALQQVRSKTFELSLPLLYDLGLESALDWLREKFQARHGLPIALLDDGQPKPLTVPTRVLLFRAAQELLLNVTKHARARAVRMAISRAGGRVRLAVEDDGVGYPPARGPVAAPAGFGLFSIRERLKSQGGWLEIGARPGGGTAAVLYAPLDLPGPAAEPAGDPSASHGWPAP